jgi:hypothetical protein
MKIETIFCLTMITASTIGFCIGMLVSDKITYEQSRHISLPVPAKFARGDLIRFKDDQVGFICSDAKKLGEKSYQYEVVFRNSNMTCKEKDLKLFSTFPWEIIQESQSMDVLSVPDNIKIPSDFQMPPLDYDEET